MVEVLFFLVLRTSGPGVAVVPVPFANEASCEREAARINGKSGLPGTWGYCIRVEAKKEQK